LLGVCICSHRNKGVNTTWETYNLGGSVGSNLACVRAATTWLDPNYIRSIVKLVVTSYIRDAIAGSKSNHIKSAITTITINDNRVVVTRAENNLSTNNYTIVNIGIRKAIINFVYNRELNNALI
jgi:hypothetical protein